METRAEPISTIAELSGVKAHTLQRHYKKISSGYLQWPARTHARQWLLYPQNAGAYISIDEVSLSNGELYTFVTNKAAKGKKGALIASIQGTRAADIAGVLDGLGPRQKQAIKEVTMDMAKNMESAIRTSLPGVAIVTDRFHVVKLLLEPVQQLRIKLRWKELEIENEQIANARKMGRKYRSQELVNGDTPKQLLARCRHSLSQPRSRWKLHQNLRMSIAFQRYPELEAAYEHAQKLLQVYSCSNAAEAKKKILQWIKDTYTFNKQEFYSCAKSLYYHLETITNFFTNRSTNASAESFNAKVKLFRANQRGVVDTAYFLFRLSKLYG